MTRLSLSFEFPAEDIDELAALVPDMWSKLRGARIFMTGGSGFIGSWMLRSLFRADLLLGLGVNVTVLARDPAVFATPFRKEIGCGSMRILGGDVRNFPFPEDEFTHVVHLAASSDAASQAADPLGLFSVIIDGTRRVLELAGRGGDCRFLLVSSGAVYGPAIGVERFTEEYPGAADCTRPGAVYGTAKRAAEQAGVLSMNDALQVMIARPFAFIGPGLPLDGHFAAGNFIRDGLAGGPIRVNGDGSPLRSYLYAADMAWWHWQILVAGTPGRAYNVGGEEAVSIRELALTVASCFIPVPAVVVRERQVLGREPSRYLPDTSRVRNELGLFARFPLSEALGRTIAWHAARK